MIESVVLALLVSKIKKYNVKLLFFEWAFYPVILCLLAYVIMQASVFLDRYTFIEYAMVFKRFYFIAFALLILRYGLFELGQGFLAGLFCISGSILNRFVVNANGGYMPVFPTLSKEVGYVGNTIMDDGQHILGHAEVKYKWLADFIDVGYSIYSIGDLMIIMFSFICLISAIKHINEKAESEEIICTI